jgi:hypothetical protein
MWLLKGVVNGSRHLSVARMRSWPLRRYCLCVHLLVVVNIGDGIQLRTGLAEVHNQLPVVREMPTGRCPSRRSSRPARPSAAVRVHVEARDRGCLIRLPKRYVRLNVRRIVGPCARPPVGVLQLLPDPSAASAIGRNLRPYRSAGKDHLSVAHHVAVDAQRLAVSGIAFCSLKAMADGPPRTNPLPTF